MSHMNGWAGFQQHLGTGYSAAPGRPVPVRGSARKVLTEAHLRNPISLSGSAGFISRRPFDSDVRMEKVAALQLAIASGTYSVSAADLADRLIRTLQKRAF